jgi:hypothetical protein
MRARIHIICWLWVLAVPSVVWATEPFVKVGTYGVDAAVLARPNGARGIAMGITGVADVTDPANVFYNPGVITFLEGIAVTQSYIDWASQPDFEMNAWDVGAAGVYRFPATGSTSFRLAGSVRFTRQSSKVPDGRAIFLPDGTGRGGATDDWYANLTAAGGATVGRLDLSLGVSVKPTRVEFADKALTGVAFDVGTVARMRFGDRYGYRVLPAVGASILNLGQDLESDEGTFGLSIGLPERARLGASLRFETPGLRGVETPFLTFTGNGDVVHTMDGDSTDSFYGGELAFVDVIMLRAGHLPEAATERTTYGLGLAWRFHKVRVAFDYTHVPDWVDAYGVWVFVGH